MNMIKPNSPNVASAPAAATSVAQPEPVRIASPDDPDVLAARKNAMRRSMQDRGGRDSTDMDRPPAYNRTQLG